MQCESSGNKALFSLMVVWNSLSLKKRGDRAGERSRNGFWLLNIFFYICIFSPTSVEYGGSYNHISSGRA